MVILDTPPTPPISQSVNMSLAPPTDEVPVQHLLFVDSRGTQSPSPHATDPVDRMLILPLHRPRFLFSAHLVYLSGCRDGPKLQNCSPTSPTHKPGPTIPLWPDVRSAVPTSNAELESCAFELNDPRYDSTVCSSHGSATMLG